MGTYRSYSYEIANMIFKILVALFQRISVRIIVFLEDILVMAKNLDEII